VGFFGNAAGLAPRVDVSSKEAMRADTGLSF
jgi:hypothetical protein